MEVQRVTRREPARCSGAQQRTAWQGGLGMTRRGALGIGPAWLEEVGIGTAWLGKPR